jgi:hypothetical protein
LRGRVSWIRGDRFLDQLETLGGEFRGESDNPVMFPPGRDKLEIRPKASMSPTAVMTIGIVNVAFLAAKAPAAPCVTRTSILSRRSSSANAGKRS